MLQQITDGYKNDSMKSFARAESTACGEKAGLLKNVSTSGFGSIGSERCKERDSE